MLHIICNTMYVPPSLTFSDYCLPFEYLLRVLRAVSTIFFNIEIPLYTKIVAHVLHFDFTRLLNMIFEK